MNTLHASKIRPVNHNCSEPDFQVLMNPVASASSLLMKPVASARLSCFLRAVVITRMKLCKQAVTNLQMLCEPRLKISERIFVDCQCHRVKV